MDAKVTGIAYETIQEKDGSLPLLTPRAAVAAMAVQSARNIWKRLGCRGVLLGGILGVAPPTSPSSAAVLSVTMQPRRLRHGANVTIIATSNPEPSARSRRHLRRRHHLASNVWTIRESSRTPTFVIGAVLILGASAPKLVRRDMLPPMKRAPSSSTSPSIRGGCCGNFARHHPHRSVYFVDNVLHYCVSNMPAAVPALSTYGLNSYPALPHAARQQRR